MTDRTDSETLRVTRFGILYVRQRVEVLRPMLEHEELYLGQRHGPVLRILDSVCFSIASSSVDIKS